MAYTDVAELRGDPDFNRRAQACYAIETLNDLDAPEPAQWTSDHGWKLAAQPGFGDAYAYALATHPDDGNPETPPYRPGNDAGVITDGMILAAVQGLRAAEAAASEGGGGE